MSSPREGTRIGTWADSGTENVTSVLFLVSLADYNASIIEDRGKSLFFDIACGVEDIEANAWQKQTEW